MISSATFKRYGCLRDVTLNLTPLHALIGPNDSGKSTALRGIETACMFQRPGNSPSDSAASAFDFLERARVAGSSPDATLTGVGLGWTRASWWIPADWLKVPKATALRLEPEAMRRGWPLIPKAERIRFASSRGAGLPAIYDAILTRNPRAFLAIEERLKVRFPSVTTLSLENENQSLKALAVSLVDDRVVPASDMSEGLLYYLAMAALPHVDDLDVLLLEEPENGLHPARIADVMQSLRDLSKTTQVIMTTHSPLVINELQGHEVTLLTRGDGGSRATLLSETHNYEERARVYSNGELWLSYADGKEEKDLVDRAERTA